MQHSIRKAVAMCVITLLLTSCDDGLRRADNAVHSFCFYNRTFEAPTFYFEFMEHLDAVTVLKDEYNSTCDPSTDVLFEEKALDGSRGTHRCRTYTSTICKSGIVTISPTNIRADTASGYGYVKNLRKTICHEVGHSLGLDHDGRTWRTAAGTSWRDCTVTGRVPDSGATAATYSAEHRKWIKDAY